MATCRIERKSSREWVINLTMTWKELGGVTSIIIAIDQLVSHNSAFFL